MTQEQPVKIIFIRPAGCDTPHKCYDNCLQMSEGTGWAYREGTVLLDGRLPIDHAWLVDGDGNIVEPTLRKSQNRGLKPEHYIPARIEGEAQP